VPSIEIICVGQRDPIDFNDLPFAVESGIGKRCATSQGWPV
jgi:hypothetical protein